MKLHWFLAKIIVLPPMILFCFVWTGSHQILRDESANPVNVPAWSAHDAKRFSNCEDIRIDHRVSDEIVVVNLFAKRYREDFATAWNNNHDKNKNNDVWVVGVCH